MTCGFISKSPFALDLIIDRETFRTVIIPEKSKTNDPVEIFKAFDTDVLEGLQRVIYVERVSTLKQLLRAKCDLSMYKVLVFDSSTELIKAGIEIIDAGTKDGMTWEFYRIMPTMINERIKGTDCGAYLSEEFLAQPDGERPKIAKLNAGLNSGQLRILTQAVMDDITDEERKIKFRLSTIRYSTGIILEDKWKTARDHAIEIGASKQKIKQLTTYIESSHGDASWQAYQDISMFGTPIETAINEAQAKRNDVDFMLEVIPADPKTLFLLDLPTQLVNRRRRMLKK